MMRYLWVLIAVGLVVGTPAQSQDLSFRGLTSQSNRADVLRVLPQALPQNYCKPGEAVTRSAEGVTLCEQLKIDEYKLGDEVFKATFYFSVDETLRYVSLLKLFGNYRTEEGLVTGSVIRSTFASLADLLSSKYGPAVASSPGSFLYQGPAGGQLEWQPGRGTKWQAGGDRISLSSEGTESKITPGMYRGSLQIFYTFARRGEFDKF